MIRSFRSRQPALQAFIALFLFWVTAPLLAATAPSPDEPLPGSDFTVIALPDTQYYVSSLNGGNPSMFVAQTSWILANQVRSNIVFVTQLGDCVEHGDNGGNDVEWRNATNALYRLEDPAVTLLPFGLPYGVAVGNHDQSPIAEPNGTTTFYNQYFGISHFAGRDYYGGHYGTNNDNHYEFFSASGLDFIIVHLEFDPAANSAVLAWANALLQTNWNRRAIVVSHYFIGVGTPGAWGPQGLATYNALKGNANLMLMLCGHISGEGRRTDVDNGRSIHTVLSDYQGRSNGGDGWLRILEFSPSNNVVRVKTYSPVLDRYEIDGDSQFNLTVDLHPPPPPCAPVPSGVINWWRANGDAKGVYEGNPGEITGGLLFAPGRVGQAFCFNGTDAAVRVPAQSTLNVGLGAGLTLELWFAPDNLLAAQPLLEWNDGSGNPGVSLWHSADENLAGTGAGSLLANLVDLSGVSHSLASAAALVVPGRFQHVALTYNSVSGDAALYLNGASVTQANLGTLTVRTASDLYFGFRPSGPGAGARFAGTLDEITLYERALAAAEVKAIYDAGPSGKCPPQPVPVTFVSHPQSQTIVQGETARFQVTVTGTGPFGYRWRKGTVTIRPFGEGTATLELASVQTNQSGIYSVVVTNVLGLPGVLSNPAILTVLADTDGDHLPDNWEKDYGLNPDDASDGGADSDGDGLTNWQEYFAGTNPTNALSSFRIINLTFANGGSAAVINFLAASNKTFTVQSRGPGNSAPWVRVEDVPTASSERPVHVTNSIPPGPSQQIYRLVTPRVP